jgi:hypothetical protein
VLAATGGPVLAGPARSLRLRLLRPLVLPAGAGEISLVRIEPVPHFCTDGDHRRLQPPLLLLIRRRTLLCPRGELHPLLSLSSALCRAERAGFAMAELGSADELVAVAFSPVTASQACPRAQGDLQVLPV